MDTLSVVKHLHDLAINPKNRASIVKDQGCLPGLVLFLDNEDSMVIKTALKTLYLLAQHGPNRKLMREEMGMIISLKDLMSRKCDIRITEMATQVHNAIMNIKTHSRKTGQKTTFLGNSNKTAKVIRLHVNGLYDQSCRSLCEEQLLQVKGVISFTFDINKKVCVVRAKHDVPAESLCQAIANTKIMQAQQVVKNEEGKEVFLSFGITPVMEEKKQIDDKSNVVEPDYLPEDDEEETSDKAVARVGQNGNNNGNGWFSGVTNFISSTLYW